MSKAQFQVDHGSGWETVAEVDVVGGIAHPPNTWTMVRALRKRIAYVSSTSTELTTAPSNPRDTHFSGFATLLVNELKVTGGCPISEVKQLVARRAYDLVHHTLHNVSLHDLDSLATEERVMNIPDLSTLPEE